MAYAEQPVQQAHDHVAQSCGTAQMGSKRTHLDTEALRLASSGSPRRRYQIVPEMSHYHLFRPPLPCVPGPSPSSSTHLGSRIESSSSNLQAPGSSSSSPNLKGSMDEFVLFQPFRGSTTGHLAPMRNCF
eukprot:scpid107884/ scgid3905/ 